MKEPWKEQRRVAGRFVRKGLDGDAGERPSTAAKAPKPSKLKTYTRARVAEALPEIVERFVEEAKNGSVPHTKLLTSLGGLDQAAPRQQLTRRQDATAVLKEIAENMAMLEND